MALPVSLKSPIILFSGKGFSLIIVGVASIFFVSAMPEFFKMSITSIWCLCLTKASEQTSWNVFINCLFLGFNPATKILNTILLIRFETALAETVKGLSLLQYVERINIPKFELVEC